MLFRVDSLNALEQFAQRFSESFTEPSIFLVYGEMGAGKTTTISAILQHWGLSFVGSPTFSLVNEYDKNEKVKVYHFDLYRLKNIHEALDIGIEEYLDADAYVFIEWPEAILPLISGKHYIVRITREGDQRIISIEKAN